MKARTGRNSHRRDTREGFAYIIALILLVVMASMGYALAVTTDLQARQSVNTFEAFETHSVVQGGLSYLLYTLTELDLKPNASGQDMFDSLALNLQRDTSFMANLDDSGVTYDSNTLTVPLISVDDNETFNATLTMPDAGTIRLTVVGTNEGRSVTLSRTLTMDLDKGTRDPQLEYGIYAKGPIDIGRNLTYSGVNVSSEGSMYSDARISQEAIVVDSGSISGDVSTGDPNAVIDVAGVTVTGKIERGVDNVAVPTVDISMFTPFATNEFDANGGLANITLTNVYIPAGTNPVFGSNVTILGVLYVESPNIVEFTNQIDITGVIVTEQPDAGSGTDENKIIFKNGPFMNGVEDLPSDDPNFTDLRELEGSAFLAPGFEIEFKNNFGSISGTIAAESITAKNNPEGIIHGSMIIMGEGGIELDNNARIAIDLSKYTQMPTGIIMPGPTILTPNPDTYLEP